MTTALKSTAATERPTRTQVWKTLGPVLSDAWVSPLSVLVDPNSFTLEILLPDNERGAVDSLLDFLVMPAGGLDLDHGWSKGQPSECLVYGHFERCQFSPLLPGIDVRVYCAIRVHDDASAHGDFSSPDPAEYQAWLEARAAAGVVPVPTVRGVAAVHPAAPSVPLLTEQEVATPAGSVTRVTGGWVAQDGRPGVHLSCGTAFGGFSNFDKLDEVVGQHIAGCTGFHDWTHEDDAVEVTDEPLPPGIEGLQVGRQASTLDSAIAVAAVNPL